MTTRSTRSLFASTLVTVIAVGATSWADPNRATPGAPTVASPTQNPTGQPNTFQAPPPVTANQAPPPVVQPMPVMQPYRPMQPVQPVEPPRRPRVGAFGMIQAGAGVPLGDLGTYLGTGFHGQFSVGWRLENGVAFRGELGYRTNSAPDLGGFSAVTYGAWLRYEIPLQSALHPYLEAGVDAGSVLASSTTTDGPTGGTTTTVSSSGTLLFAGGAAGLLIDLNDRFALEATVRYEQVISTQGGEGLSGGMLSALGGASLTF